MPRFNVKFAGGSTANLLLISLNMWATSCPPYALHRDATVDISKFNIVKAMFPEAAGKYAGPE